MIKFHRLQGSAARPFTEAIADLRLKVFWDFPYLYEGSRQYEINYLETYFRASHSFLFLVEDAGEIVGVSTGILAEEEEASFKEPFLKHGLDPREVFYFGESILRPEYRGRGLGKIFFEEREAFARSLEKVRTMSFCAVERPENHPLRPENYRPLDDFWRSMGFLKEPGLKTRYEWKDRNEKLPTHKDMQFWLKPILKGAK